MVMAAGLLFAAAPAGAMTGLEFLQAQEDNSYRDVAVMKSLVIQFVSQGSAMFLTRHTCLPTSL
jgi:hypothetical protein